MYLTTLTHREPVGAEKVFLCKTTQKKMAYTEEELKKELETKEYEYGFYTDIDFRNFSDWFE